MRRQQAALERRDTLAADMKSKTPNITIGLDLGDKKHAICVLNKAGDILEERSIAAVIVTDLIGHDASLDDLHLRLPGWARFAAGMAFPNIGKLVAVMGSETDGTFPGIIEAAASRARDLRVVPTQYG
jgi:hypothetical protein